MQNFGLYFSVGREHILDFKGVDHILFVTALCILYEIKHWKKLLILITAFTVGHTITLALSVLNLFSVEPLWIEFLIPTTIAISATYNLFFKDFNFKSPQNFKYILTFLFGLIHGMGFSNYLKSLLGKSNSIWQELLAFNLGLELGQLIIVCIVLLIGWLTATLLKFSKREVILIYSSGILFLSLQMVFERWPF